MAYKYLGRTAKLYPARNSEKKYSIYDKKNDKWINFGQLGYEDYTKHHPRHPNGGWNLGVDKPEKWATYEKVRQTYLSGKFDGIGVLLTKGSGIVGVDIDDWKSKFADHPRIFSALHKLILDGGYVETSPSGMGLRAFVQGALNGPGRKNGGLEIYDDVRFLTVTGHRLEALDVNAI
jgi:primase-polymerase (primpol)-like protein